MNTQIFTCGKLCTKAFIAAALLCIATESANAEWTIDFSRRARANREADLNAAAQAPRGERSPASTESGTPTVMSTDMDKTKEKGLFDTIFDAGEPIQDVVILHTEKGFVPQTVRVRKNGRYKITIVNVNEKEKNVSFILDGFSEHHATYYGKIKTFNLEPKKEGAYSFQSPETSAEGKLVVFNPQMSMREPASESGK